MTLSGWQEILSHHFGVPDPYRAQDILTDQGANVLAIGGRRIAVSIDNNYIAKIAWRRAGLADNEIEWRVWQTAKPDIQALLCPAVSFKDYGVLVQARCLPVSAEAYPEAARDLIRKLAEAGISDAAVNLGIYDQELVCYDYCLLRPELLRSLL